MKDELLKLLNTNVADMQVMFVKLHNFHWNIKGMQFKPVHEQTESYYDYFAEQYDEAAERILQLGGKPFSSMKEYLENSSLKEEALKDFDAKYVLTSILSDFEMLVAKFKEISSAAGKIEDMTTAGYADGNVAWLEKEIWMIKAILTEK